jgi:prepilin-type N-terminal cleavage/methylation domain-containing protein
MARIHRSRSDRRLRSNVPARGAASPVRAAVRRKAAARGGFTLIELGIVILVIGILLAFVLAAGAGALEASRQRSTQALIQKLDLGLTERFEMLSREVAPVNLAHEFMGSVILPGGSGFRADDNRAQVIANIDRMKADNPDVFFVQIIPPLNAPASPPLYPLNFAALRAGFPITGMIPLSSLGAGAPLGAAPAGDGGGSFLEHYILPYGNAMLNNVEVALANGVPPTTFGAVPVDINGLPQYPEGYTPQGTGIFGATYTAAGAIYKNLGYNAAGFDAVDNNGNGYVDEWQEGVNATNQDLVITRLQSHQHRTARAEMLYALLIESRGNAGPVFSSDDFTSDQAKDTDNDGLPEFVDAWGEPVQFYRWPTHHVSDIQRGWRPYPPRGSTHATTRRETHPLDSNELLVDPSWWGNLNALQSTTPMSENAVTFQSHFFSLLDPSANASGAVGIDPPNTPGTYAIWDRNGFFKRRSFFCKALIVSAGPDRNFGTPLMGFLEAQYGDGRDSLGNPLPPDTARTTNFTARSALSIARDLITCENEAAPYSLTRLQDGSASARNPSALNQGVDVTRYTDANAQIDVVLSGFPLGDEVAGALSRASGDDITNHTTSSAGTGGSR